MILLDAETIPPPRTEAVLAAIADRLDPKLAEYEIAEASELIYERLSLTPIWARLLCMAWTHNDEIRSEGWNDQDVIDHHDGVPDVYNRVERRILGALFDSANELRPGRWGSYGIFDLHVLRGACLRHGRRAALMKLPGGPLDKWGKNWLDFSEGWAERQHRPRLGDVIAQLGLGKTEGMHGSEVLGAFRRGEVAKIQSYCCGDVVGLKALAQAVGVNLGNAS